MTAHPRIPRHRLRLLHLLRPARLHHLRRLLLLLLVVAAARPAAAIAPATPIRIRTRGGEGEEMKSCQRWSYQGREKEMRPAAATTILIRTRGGGK